MTLSKLPVSQGGGQQALGPYAATTDYVKQQINLLIDQINSGGGSSDIQTVTIPLSSNEINHLFSAPKTLIAAPGLGKAIVCLSVQRALTVGSIPFDSENGSANVYYNSSAGLSFLVKFDNVSSSVVTLSTVVYNFTQQYTAIEDLPIVAAGDTEDLASGGAIATSVLGVGGAGYAHGDTGSISPQTTATYVVDTVSGGGAVLTYHISDPGYGNNTGVHTTVVSTGGGDGNFTINITTITPGNGSSSVTVVYQVIELP